MGSERLVKTKTCLYLRNTEKSRHTDPVSFRVYNSLKKDPISFYQLDEARELDLLYYAFRSVNGEWEIFRKTPFSDISGAKEACESITQRLINALQIFDNIIEDFQDIIQHMDNGKTSEIWVRRKQTLEQSIGSIYAEIKKL